MSAQMDRRGFLGSVAGAGAALMLPRPSASQTRPGSSRAPDGRPLNAGLVGCGGRGRGATANFLDVGAGLQVTALADVFPDRLEEARRQLKEERGQDIAAARCFTGFDACEKLLATDVDVVLHATPPHFRPQHFAAAVAAGKHVFLEKPVAVDAAGSRDVMATAERAASQGLSVMTGTQLRRERARVETRTRIRDGAIGDIVSMRAFRNQGALWYRERQTGWSDMEFMLRDWVNWTWLSGDHIVEMHIHHLDQMVWIMGNAPVKAVGLGARMRRPTGDQYDFFSVDYTFANDVHLHSTIRQISGCANLRDETIEGTRGSAGLEGVIRDRAGKVIWKYEGETNDSLVQEHVDWVTAIRTGTPINTARDTAVSTLVAVMGRDSAYTGRTLTWDDMMASTERLGPTTYALGPVDLQPTAPVPGHDSAPLTQ